MNKAKSHKCIKCGKEMNRCDRPQHYGKIWDLGVTGAGVTISTSTSGSKFLNLNASRIPINVDYQKIELILYQCPKCKYKDSFPE